MENKKSTNETISQVRKSLQIYFQISKEKVIDPKKIRFILHDIRNFLIMTSSEDRESVVDALRRQGFLVDVTKFMNKPSYFDPDILEEVTWIFLLVFSLICEEKLLRIVHDTDIIVVLVRLMTYNQIEIFSNIVWCLANIMNSNHQMKELYKKLQILQKIEQRMQELDQNSAVVNPSFYQSYLIFLESYICTSPYDEPQASIQNYLDRCLKLYVHSSKELLICFQEDLLSCICHLFHFVSEATLEAFLVNPTFGTFLNSLFVNLTKPNCNFKNLILSILCNLTFNLLEEFLSIFEKPQIQEVLTQRLRDPKTMPETVNLLGNVFLSQKVTSSVFTNNKSQLCTVLFEIFCKKVELEPSKEYLIDDLLRTIQNFLLFGESKPMITFCLSNQSSLIEYFNGRFF